MVPVWKRGYTGQGVTVTVLDDGLEKDHPDLKDNYVSAARHKGLFTPSESLSKGEKYQRTSKKD